MGEREGEREGEGDRGREKNIAYARGVGGQGKSRAV